MSSCSWPGRNLTMQQYHDNEWCVPSHDDAYIFEMLTLEGAQSGLSWSIVLAKREGYQKAFQHFNIEYCSKLTDEELETIKEQYNIIKNRTKINAVRSNALAVINIQKEFGSFSTFLWNYVDDHPVINSWVSEGQMPAQTPLSEQISKDLKKRGFKFVGPVIIYSFMQAIGMVDDHLRTCPYHSTNR
ncbi:DNA-3-methyladenine glycosylase I [Desulfosporosinus nitroreducens]|uniref:DNA-3-methyladenine glycosylase I n=1 Tax=Desulfosporosinus nitroreducens TaxID=2018668 RepID=A0ABT8QYF1_9FIRM|nr:DNA-3-methyladenine glycosylase I [Desulfosporosinus nitroreducens]MCO1604453.1 DNA-3-methyladenine glycosylase I [Desulfosporosinus nitroreducens]MDO0825514.1 DNA-3-methyladenine glycosylase I [Desulfosporosinus nitroreducens]